jgi:hypothetical protein
LTAIIDAVDLARPYSLVSSSADLDVLAVLARTTDSLSGREIARRAGRSQEWTRKVLERLVEHGIALRRLGGSALLYDLNRTHLAAPAVEQLVELRPMLVDRLRAELAEWDVQPAAAALFGSAARGDGGTDSDIDLFVVRPAAVQPDDPAWIAQTDGLATGVRAWTGNNASIVESSVDELADLIDRAPPILDSIGTDAVDLSARPVRSLLRSAR